MVKVRPLGLFVTALVGFVVVLLALRWAQTQGIVIPAPGIVPVLILGFALVLLVLGWRVRQFVRGRASMDAIAASRVAALAVTAGYVGALLAGLGLAQVVAVAGFGQAPAARSDAVIGSLTAAASLALLACGLLVQAWCEIPDDDDDPGAGGDSDEMTRS